MHQCCGCIADAVGILEQLPKINGCFWYIRYILPIGGIYTTYHLLWEPETTIEKRYPRVQIT